MTMADPVHLLPDGHWSASGHAAVAQALLRRFAIDTVGRPDA